MKMKSSFALLSVSLLLGGCASLVKSQQQDITLKTPNETDVICYFDNGTLQYKFYSGDTKVITKNHQDIQATCMAPGNREKTFTIPWIVEPWTYANAVNGVVPGVTYDVLSRAAFAYPDVVTVDFAGQKMGAYPIPNAREYVQHGIESYAPSVPAIPSDASASKVVVRKRGESELQGQSNPFKSEGGVSGHNDDMSGGGSAYSWGGTPDPLPTSKYDPSKEIK